MKCCTVVDIRKDKYDEYIGRAGDGLSGYFGNLFKLARPEDRAAVLAKYETYFFQRMERDKFFRARVYELRGKVLGCFCAPMACHGDIIARHVNTHFGDA